MTEPPAAFESASGASTMPGWYPELLDSVVGHISTGSRRAYLAVNRELIATYWAIGHEILTRMREEGWGTRVVHRLSADIKNRFPEARGYSPRNLRYMRSFAEAWPDQAMLQQPVATLPWRQQIALLEKLQRTDQRLWYADRALQEGWSSSVLTLQIEHRLHERAGKAISNFSATLPPEDSDLVQQATKDPYVFDFLGHAERRRERDLELGLIEHIEQFLLELGQGFAFVGRQYRLTIDDTDFFADLLLYNYRLHAFVVVELKADKFRPEHTGQLGMYMAAVDDLLAGPLEKSTIGLLLCKTKNDRVAEYALRATTAPIGVAKWTEDLTARLTNELPGEFRNVLPTIAELEAELRDLTEPGEPS